MSRVALLMVSVKHLRHHTCKWPAFGRHGYSTAIYTNQPILNQRDKSSELAFKAPWVSNLQLEVTQQTHNQITPPPILGIEGLTTARCEYARVHLRPPIADIRLILGITLRQRGN